MNVARISLFAALIFLTALAVSACSINDPTQKSAPPDTKKFHAEQTRYQNFMNAQAHIDADLAQEERAREARQRYDTQIFWEKQKRAFAVR